MVSLNEDFQQAGVSRRVSAGRRAHKVLFAALLSTGLLSIAIGPVDVSLWVVLQKLTTGQSLSTLEYVQFLGL